MADRAQGGLPVPREEGPAAAAVVGEVLRRARGALLHLRPRQPRLHQLAAGRLRLPRPHDPKPGNNTSWGDMNLVDAERRLVATALLDLANARFTLLSESCVPLLSSPAVYAFLTGSNASFVDSYVDGARHAPFFTQRNVSLAQWRKGSQWFEMDRAIAVEVVAKERFMAVFRGHHGVANMEEHYLPTLVTLLGWGARNANRTLTYAKWRAGAWHPVSYGGTVVTAELLEGMRRGNGECGYRGGGGAVEFCFMFARKFSGDALGKLLELAPKVMGFG
ncbi:unnamed protein product [Triticum turgidum subsp. durum]|uniref:Uncharacterized protein n=1 Tax=Triticum turgidum subsp. durum TaxID=4567 RepID=A0A9R0VDQ7_TRITD|nr:unnamed protein product [Triticum turgidum subsp. durum]